ncbi:MAG: Gfo/Idh/MocA family oxidoreductase [Verrucomicrobiales bacterium]|nr:Gfo/Idh/MocA family oxidoreductase [Verrucomicrobiales bacterium]
MNIAITGTGFMGATHAEALRRLGHTLVGIQGSSQEKSDRAAKAYGATKGYASYQELCADPDVEAVHITTPNRLHFAQAKAALEAGKHVFCEKPLTMDANESGPLAELAASSGLAAGVNYNSRFYPLCQEAKERVRAGSIGDVTSVRGCFVQDWLLYDTDYNWRVLAEEGGDLRAVGDIGTHWLDLVQDVTGLGVSAVFAELKTVHPVRQRPKGEVETFAGPNAKKQETYPIDVTTDDLGTVLLRFSNGAHGNLFVSQVTAGVKCRGQFEISGTKNAIAWSNEDHDNLWLGHRDVPNETLTKDPGLCGDAARPYIGYPGGHAEGYPDSFKMTFKSFYDYIAAGDLTAKPPFATFADGHREIQLCDAILLSQKEQRWVEV